MVQRHENRRNLRDGARLRLTERDDRQVYATVQVQIGNGETADVGQLHPDAETAATWALAFQPATCEAAGVMWIQTHERGNYECWKAGLGTNDRAEITSFSVEDWGVERHIGIGARGFTLKLTGYDFNHERDGRNLLNPSRRRRLRQPGYLVL